MGQEDSDRLLMTARSRGGADDAEHDGARSGDLAGDRDENGLVLCVVTPISAGLDAEKHQLKTLRVMFDRTPADEIVVPRRWGQLMFENVSADAAAPAEMRQMAATMAATTICSDVLLPADSDTVEIAVPDSQGNMATFEALPPGTRMRARLDRNPSRAETCVTFKPQEDSIVAHPVCAQFVPNPEHSNAFQRIPAHDAVGTHACDTKHLRTLTETKA